MSAVERFEPGREISEREWANIERRVESIAISKLCPKQFRGKPEELKLVAMTCTDVGVPFNLNTVDRFFVIDGKVNMMAQLQIAVAGGHGIDVWPKPGGYDDKSATVFVQKPGKPPREITYTLEMARDYGLLDEWVERRVKDGSWPDGNPKYKTETCTISVDGVPVDAPLPKWAQEKLDAGEAKRKDPWFRARTQMLLARAVTLGLNTQASSALLGIRNLDLGDDTQPPTGDDGETGEIHTDPTAKDDEPADGELVDTPPPPGGSAKGTGPSAGPAPDAADRADAWDRTALQTELAELDTEHRLIASKAWREAGLPKIDSDALTKDHEADAHRILSTVSVQQKETYKTRQKRANAALGSIGVKGDDRHAAVREATDGETESTGKLSSTQIDAVVAWVEEAKRAAAAEDPFDADDSGQRDDEPPVQDELDPEEF